MTPAELAHLDDVVKTQKIRVLDVLVIGPLMIWGGLVAAGRLPVTSRGAAAGEALALFGVTTMIYNAINWKKIDDAGRGLKRP